MSTIKFSKSDLKEIERQIKKEYNHILEENSNPENMLFVQAILYYDKLEKQYDRILKKINKALENKN